MNHPHRNESFYKNFFLFLYFYQNATECKEAIYHSIARNLLYKRQTEVRQMLIFCWQKKFKKQKFTAIFESVFFKYFDQMMALEYPSQKNKNRFLKPVKNCIFWYIKLRKKTRGRSASLQNKDDHYVFFSIKNSFFFTYLRMLLRLWFNEMVLKVKLNIELISRI